jgi:hypothetical protein
MTFSKMRLLDYKLRCEVSDTMTDMREDWTAEFFSLSYVYKGRGMIKKESAQRSSRRRSRRARRDLLDVDGRHVADLTAQPQFAKGLKPCR